MREDTNEVSANEMLLIFESIWLMKGLQELRQHLFARS